MVKNSNFLLECLVKRQPRFSTFLGVVIKKVSKTKLLAELLVKKEFTNRNGVMHGGAIMAFADDVGGAATFINLSKGMSTTTIESKTNFFRPIQIGDQITGECNVLKKGRKIVVVQTTIFRPDMQIAAIVTQTQMILKFKMK